MRSLSVLIVDDSISARKLLRSVLMGLGKRIIVYEAAKGTEALYQCKLGYFDIVFLDIEMPDIDGFEVLKQIKLEIPDQYIVIVSGNTTVENVKKTLAYGGKGFIAKPYKTEKVDAAINKFLQEKC